MCLAWIFLWRSIKKNQYNVRLLKVRKLKMSYDCMRKGVAKEEPVKKQKKKKLHERARKFETIFGIHETVGQRH